RDDLGKLPGLVPTIARHEPHRARRHVSEDPDAVVLGLERPVIAARDARGYPGEHGRNALVRLVVPGNLLHAPPRGDRRREFADDIRTAFGVLIVMLDQQPLRTIRRAAPCPHEHPRAVQALAVKNELQIAISITALERFRLIITRRVTRERAPIPEHDGTTTVLPLGNRPFEAVVLDRMILHLHRQPLHGWIGTRSLRNGPALHDIAELQPEVEVEMTRGVLLHDKGERAGGTTLCRDLVARWFGGSGEVALGAIALQ